MFLKCFTLKHKCFATLLPSYSWVLAKRPAGCPGVRLVGKSCLSVRSTFGHISGTGRPINFVFGMWQRAARAENVLRTRA